MDILTQIKKRFKFTENVDNDILDVQFIQKRKFKDLTTKISIQKMSSAIALLLFLNVTLLAVNFNTISPYAITTKDGDAICYVKDEKSAKNAIHYSGKILANSLVNTSNDSCEVVSIKSDLHIEKAKVSDVVKVDNNAIKSIINESKNNNKVNIEVEAIKTETTKTKPKVIYKANDSMLAGKSSVTQKGESETNEKVISYKIINGEEIKKSEVASDVTKEGKDTIIEKGVLGLPDGENFKTYTGLPVCKDGNDIVKTAYNYVGKLPYKWGGKDLETGVDCSGFVMALYKLYGVTLNYPLQNEGIHVDYEDAKPGDILYFPGHFGLYIGDGKMIHAPRTGEYVSEAPIGGRTILDIRRIVTE